MSLTESPGGKTTLLRNTDNLLIDLDGTLVDSMDCLRSTYFAFLSRFEKTGSLAEFSSLIGPPLKAVVIALKHNHGLEQDVNELSRIYGEIMERNYELCLPLAGARELLETAGNAGKQLALVTGAHSETTGNLFSRLDWRGFFNVVITGDLCRDHKPDPEPYQRAMAALGASADNCLVIEDSENGIRSACAAGIETIGLCRESDRNTLIKAGATYCFEDLEALASALKRAWEI